MQAEHHADDPGTARIGLVRGLLVIVTAIALGAFVLSRANFTDDPVEAVAAGSETGLEGSNEGSDTDPAVDGATDPATTPPGLGSAAETTMADAGDGTTGDGLRRR